jgi:bifunctional UDP-N-acetylglucosamine pyrophosphorylase / glucosamine-1-phosphate N-acetyltransferase
VVYGVELFEQVADRIVVVVGAYASSVRQAVGDRPEIIYAVQEEPMGTGHALKTAVDEMEKQNIDCDVVVVGYADHMMFYTPDVAQGLVAKLVSQKAKVALLTTSYTDPDILKWGRIVRDAHGAVQKIIEQKDASDAERQIQEVNPGFYCFDWEFLKENKNKLKKSPVSGEYYVTDFVQVAVEQGLKVVPEKVPFEKVGVGVNTREELEEDEKLI